MLNDWFAYCGDSYGSNLLCPYGSNLLCPPVDLFNCERVGNKVKLTFTEDAIKEYNSWGWKDIREKLRDSRSGTLRVYNNTGFVDVYPDVRLDAVCGTVVGNGVVVHKLQFSYTRRERYDVFDMNYVKNGFRYLAWEGK